MTKRLPANWTPPYPTWAGRFDGQVSPLVFGYFACQFPATKDGSGEFRSWWASARATASGPEHDELAAFTDTSGATNIVAIAYWRDRAEYQRWWCKVSGWWDEPARERGPGGYWREIHVVAPTHFETAFATRNPAGVVQAADGFGDELQEHAYWGSMRDRIQASATDAFASQIGQTLATVDPTRSPRIRLRVPDNLVMIRSAQDWRACDEKERDYYLQKVHPVLLKGMNFLRDNPIETGCLSLRFMTEEDGSGQKTFATGHFASLGHLEVWAEHHPTHVAIFQTFLKMVRDFDFDLKLKLWHEVTVLHGSACLFEYINCHADTGSLRFVPSVVEVNSSQ